MIGYRHADPRYPFLWESSRQPGARWHEPGDGPVHYLASTPDAAWAEEVIVLFGPRPDMVGWAACAVGHPREDLLPRVRRLRQPVRAVPSSG